MKIFFLTVMVLLPWALRSAAADRMGAIVVNSRRVHLRSADAPEWDHFASQTPDGRRLDLRFTAQPNAQEATLFLRQDDVKQDWGVELNEKRLGKLFLMEADLVHVLKVPARRLREGDNLLSIIPPKEKDDIVLQEIRIEPLPLSEAVGQTTLIVNVSDAEAGGPLPCRITVVDARGFLAPLVGLTNSALAEDRLAPHLAVRPGVIYTGNGEARVGLPAGEYTVFASRGFEWGVARRDVRIETGGVSRVSLVLRREVATPGLVSCDTHVHTFTFSGHGDATIDERMLTLAGEGIELPVATDHNIQIDYSEAARRMRVSGWFTPVTGNEVTTAAGHFNIFPVDETVRAPDFRVTDWPALMKGFRALPDLRVVVLNHPRNVHSGFQPFAATNYNSVTGENKRGPEFSFDAIELMNSSAQQTDYMLVYRDWFALLNYGYRATGVGSSDGHDVSRYIVGQGRTYIVCPDQNPARLDVAVACSNLLAGRAVVSMGLLTQMTVNERFGPGDLATNLGQSLRVNLTVSGPSWVSATNAALFANGVKIRETDISATTNSRLFPRGDKTNISWVLPRFSHDVHLVAIAMGPAVTAPFWAIPRPYQPTSGAWEGRVIGSTNPIWIDSDADGRFTPARGYARQLVNRHRGDATKLLEALGDFDEAVAAQAASLCAAADDLPEQPQFAQGLKNAAVQVRRGFAAFAATAR